MKRILIFIAVIFLLVAFAGQVYGVTREIAVREVMADGNTAPEAPAGYINDGSMETIWRTNETTPPATWIELQFEEKALIEGLQLVGPYQGELTVFYREGVWRPFMMGRRLHSTLPAGAALVDLSYDRVVTDGIRLQFANLNAETFLGGLAEVKVLGRGAGERLERLDPVEVTTGDRFSWDGPGRKFRLQNPAELIFDHNTYSGWQVHRGGPYEPAEAVVELGASCRIELIKIFAGAKTGDGKAGKLDCRIRMQYHQQANNLWVDIPGLVNNDLEGMQGRWIGFDLSGREIVTSRLRLLLTGRDREAVLREVEIWGRRLNILQGSRYQSMVSGPATVSATQPANFSFTLTAPAEGMNLHLAGTAPDSQSAPVLQWELNGRAMGNLTPVMNRNGRVFYRQPVPCKDLWSGVNYLRIRGGALMTLEEVCLEAPSHSGLDITAGNDLRDRLTLTPGPGGEQILELGGQYHLDYGYLSYLGSAAGIRFFAERAGGWEELVPAGVENGVMGGDLIFTGIGIVSRLKISAPSGVDGLTEIGLVGSKINDGPPLVRILTPGDGEVLSLTEWIKADLTGTVENPAAEVRVNGQKILTEGTTFVIPVTQLGLKPDESKVIEVTAIDAEGRQSSDRITVSIGALPVFTLDLPAEVFYTNASEITITGQTVSPNVNVTVNNVTVPLRNRRFSTTVGLQEGLNRILVRVEAGGNRVSVKERLVVKNSALPFLRVSSPLPGAVLREEQVIVTGTAGGLSPVRVTVNDEQAMLTGGSFQSRPLGLQEGENKIRVTASYTDGRATTVELTVTGDRTEPLLSVIAPEEGAICSTAAIRVSGQVSDTSPVAVLVNGRAAVINDGNFTVTVTLNEGPQNLRIEARDAAGNLSVKNRPVLVDTIAPEKFTPIAIPATWTSDNRPVILFSTVDSGSGIDHYELQLGEKSLGIVKSPYRFAEAVPDGKHMVKVIAVDRADHTQTGDDTWIYIDTTPPKTPPSFRVVPGEGRMVLKWNAPEPDDKMKYLLEREPAWSPSLQETSSLECEDPGLADGVTYRYRIRAVDRAANEGPVSEWVEGVVGVAEAPYVAGEGGFVEYDGVSLVLPQEGMPAEVVRIEVTEVQSEYLESKVLYPAIGPLYEFSAVKEDGSYCEHLTTDQGFVGKISYDETRVPEGFPEQNLGVYYYDTMFDRWFQIDSAAIDVENNTIYFITNHFTSFSVQATVVQDLSPQEYKDAGYSPLRTYAEHAGISISPQGGTASTSAVELVLPGRNGFDFVLKRRYDTATARSDAFALSINGSMAFNFCNPGTNGGNILSVVQATEQLTTWQQVGRELEENIRNIIEQYLFSQGDYAYSMGQGWRLNIPYMKAANSAMMLCTADGAMYSVGEMEIIHAISATIPVGPTLVQGREITFRQREGDDFVLTAIQVNANFDITGLFTRRKDEIFKSRWYSLYYRLTMKDGTVYEMDALGRTIKITDPTGLNVIHFFYDGLFLHHIVDSVGRIVRFEYGFNPINFLWTRITRIWVENDPLEREIRYNVNLSGLLESAQDAGDRVSRYDYDFKIMYGGEVGFKLNIMAIILKAVCGPLGQMLGPIIGVNDLEVFGRVSAQAVFVMKEMEAPGQGRVTIAYSPRDVLYGSTKIEYWLAVPISATFSLIMEQRLLAERVTVYLDGAALRTTTYEYDFNYYDEGQPFISRTVENDGKKKTVYYYTPVRRTRIRWQDASYGGVISFPVLFWRVDILPINHEVEVLDAGSDTVLERTTTSYNVDTMRPVERMVRRGVDYRRVTYVYDDWGNVIHSAETSQSGDRVNRVRTWTHYHDTISTPVLTMQEVPAPYTPPVLTRFQRNLPLYQLTINEAPAGIPGLSDQTLRTCYRYNGIGQMTAEARWNGSAWLETRYEYHPVHGSVTRKIDAEEHETVYSYDAYGYPSAITEKNVVNARGEITDIVTRMGYDRFSGWKVWQKNPRGYVTQYVYDALGRMMRTVKPEDNDDPAWVPDGSGNPHFRADNPILTVQYNDTDLWAMATDPLGRRTKYDFDDLGRMVELVKYALVSGEYVAAAVTKLQYDPWGNITVITDPNGNARGPAWRHTTRYTYDALGRNTEIIYPDETENMADNPRKRMDFDYGTNVLTIWDENNNKTVEYQDMQGRTIRQLRYDDGREIEVKRYFDGVGNEVAVVDPKGSMTVNRYNCLNQPERVTLPAEMCYENNSESLVTPYQRYEYDLAGHKTKEIRSMPGGTEHVTEYVTDSLGRVIRTRVSYTDMEVLKEAITEVYYDGNGNKVRVVDANNTPKDDAAQAAAVFTYTADDQLRTETDALGNTTSYTYDRAGNRVSMTDARGNSGRYTGDFTVIYEYDDLNRLVKGKLPRGPGMTGKPEVSLVYDARGNLKERIEPDGGKTLYTYDPRNRPVTVTVQGDGASYVTKHTYDEVGNELSIEDPAGNPTIKEYDDLYRLVKVTYPEKNTEQYDYDDNNNRTLYVNGKQIPTKYSYDRYNRLVEIENVKGGLTILTIYGYDRWGNMSRMENAAGHVTKYTYDEMNRLVKETDPQGFVQSFRYDGVGNRIEGKDPNGTVSSYQYYLNNLLKQVTLTNGARSMVLDYSYDEAGMRKTARCDGVTVEYNKYAAGYIPDPYGRVQREAKNVNGRVFTVDYKYDVTGRMTGVKYPTGTWVEYQYNNLNQLVKVPGYIEEKPVYNEAGFLTGIKTVNGVATSYDYDTNGRLTKLGYDNAEGLLKEYRLDYDAANNIFKKNNDDFDYDELNQLVFARLQGKFEVNQEEEIQQVGKTADDYDGQNRLELVADLAEIVEFDYAAGSIGVDLQVEVPVTRVELSPANPAHRIRERNTRLYYSLDNQSYTEISGWRFVDGEDGKIGMELETPVLARFLKVKSLFDQRDMEFEAISKATFVNQASKLIRVYYVLTRRQEEYDYDAIGNRTSEKVTQRNMISRIYSYYPQSSRLQSNGKYQYEYDPNGNLLKKTALVGEPEEWIYGYDLLNRLVKVEKNGKTVAEYTYDEAGLRVKKSKAGVEIYYVFDGGGNVIYEEENGGYTEYIYVLGKHFARNDGVLGSGERTRYYYHCDHLGSTVVVTDDQGQKVWDTEYLPFGRMAVVDGELEKAGKFTGKDLDEDTGLYYFNARWYDQGIGRFISKDLIQEEAVQELNQYNRQKPSGVIDGSFSLQAMDPAVWYLYTYCRNNSIIRTDPDGRRDRYEIIYSASAWMIYSKSPLRKIVEGILSLSPIPIVGPFMNTFFNIQDKAINSISTVTNKDITNAALYDLVSLGTGEILQSLADKGDKFAKVLNGIKVTYETGSTVASTLKDLTDAQADALGLRILSNFFDGDVTNILPGKELCTLDGVHAEELKAALALVELYLSGKTTIDDPSGKFQEAIGKAWDDLDLNEPSEGERTTSSINEWDQMIDDMKAEEE